MNQREKKRGLWGEGLRRENWTQSGAGAMDKLAEIVTVPEHLWDKRMGRREGEVRKGRKGGGRESIGEGTGGGEGGEKGERHTVEQTSCRIGAAQFSAGTTRGQRLQVV